MSEQPVTPDPRVELLACISSRETRSWNWDHVSHESDRNYLLACAAEDLAELDEVDPVRQLKEPTQSYESSAEIHSPQQNDRVAEIQQRADAATDGPWVDHWWGIEGESVDVLVVQDDYESSRQDFEFIANAREDVPFLLAELARYQAAVQAVENFFLFAEDDRAALGLGIAERGVRAVLAEHLGDER